MPEAEKDSHVTLQVCYKLKNKFMRHNKNQFRLHKTFKFSLLLCWKQSSKKKKKNKNNKNCLESLAMRSIGRSNNGSSFYCHQRSLNEGDRFLCILFFCNHKTTKMLQLHCTKKYCMLHYCS